MRVLWFSNTPANSDEYFNSELKGTGGWLKSLDRALQDSVELHVAFYHHQGSSSFRYKNTTYHPINRGKHRLELIKSRIFNYVMDQEDLDLYLELIQQVQPDIIHIHGTENPFGCILDNIEIPAAVSIQGNITIYHHKYFSGIEKQFSTVGKQYFSNIKKILLEQTFLDVYKRFGKMKNRELNNLKSCQNIIGRTDWDRRITRLFAPRSKYYHCDEILRDQFYTAQWQPPNNDKLILHTTSGNSLYKGFETICQALTELNRYGLEVEWRVAGISKDDSIVKAVKKKLTNNYPTQGLKLLGKIDANELVLRLLEADIYIMPSHIENSPNSLCEAMLLGLPCIATFAGGTSSLLQDGKEGILVQDGDPWAMAGAILEFSENPAEAEHYGLLARERSHARHSDKKIVTNLLDIYRRLSGGGTTTQIKVS